MRNVTVIPASLNKFSDVPLATTKKRKVAAYARVSTDDEDQQTSYAAQCDYYERYIKSREDWEFVRLYSDEGISGCNTKKREGFRSMVQDALDGKIELIIAKSLSRFSRNTVDSLTTIRKLKENGVEVWFEKEYIQNGGNPCKIRTPAIFLCPFVAYLSLKSTNRYKKIMDDKRLYSTDCT